MKISFNWLKTYLPITVAAEEVAEILTDIGLEVEKLIPFETVPGGLKGVVVGKVLDVVPHPDADRLRVTTVDVGGPENLTIVCGAPNVGKDQKVFVATVGTVLQPNSENPLTIKKSKIRGVESFGMICAEDELGIGESHDGIMVLPETAEIGSSAADFLGMETDQVFEIGLTPNRTDAFGHYGVARDLAARLSLKQPIKAKLPEFRAFGTEKEGNPAISVEVIDTDGCGRYAGLYLKNVEVGPSPNWLQNRLRSIGLNPINNVVDITNFVLHETGQPLHAFDADKIRGGKVIVKTLPEGSTFKTLDGVERKLHGDDLMICDAEGGMCIAGVFGGGESGVTESTKNVFLESAWFNPVRVRKAAKRHALNTDASFRFERGVDPNETLYALRHAAVLMESICNAKVSGPLVDIVNMDLKPVIIDFSVERCNKLCGTQINEKVLEGIFDSLDIKFNKLPDGHYSLAIPTYRVDVTREVDVVEEILRIYGYNRVDLPERMQLSVSIGKKPTREEVFDQMAGVLTGRGFSEMMANGLTRSDHLVAVGGKDLENSLVSVLNPLSSELDVLRPSLISSALEAVAFNLNRQSERLMLFELGTVYFKKDPGYGETTNLGLVLTGSRFSENWNNQSMPFDHSDLKGHLLSVLEVMGISDDLTFADGSDAFFAEAQTLQKAGKTLGQFGLVSPAALKRFGIKKPVFFAELNLSVCMKMVKHAGKTYAELPKFPAVRRDFSLLLDKDVPFSAIADLARKSAGSLLKEAALFDVYEGKNLPPEKKSYAVSFVLQDANRTLNDKYIDKTMKDIQTRLETELGAILR